MCWGGGYLSRRSCYEAAAPLPTITSGLLPEMTQTPGRVVGFFPSWNLKREKTVHLSASPRLGAEGRLRIDGHFVSPGCSRLLPDVGGPDDEVDQCGGGCVAGP